MTNEKIILKISRWQECPYTMDLVCPLEKDPHLLESSIVDGEVKLKCPNCDFTSEVPQTILRDEFGQVVS